MHLWKGKRNPVLFCSSEVLTRKDAGGAGPELDEAGPGNKRRKGMDAPLRLSTSSLVSTQVYPQNSRTKEPDEGGDDGM